MDPCDLALEVLQYHFCHILLVYSGPTQVQCGRGWPRDMDPRRCDTGEEVEACTRYRSGGTRI